VPQCTCPDYEERGEPCKHVFAVRYVVERESHPDGSETVTETIAVTQRTCAPRKTDKQDWTAYDAAQANEKAKFQALLCGLRRAVPEPPRKPGPGRKPIPLCDAVFAAAFKVYSTVSARRFMCDLDGARERGYIAKTPHYAAISDTLENASLTPILRS